MTASVKPTSLEEFKQTTQSMKESTSAVFQPTIPTTIRNVLSAASTSSLVGNYRPSRVRSDQEDWSGPSQEEGESSDETIVTSLNINTPSSSQTQTW